MLDNKNTPVKIHKGLGLRSLKHSVKHNRYYVFDFDETIGSFSDLYILYKCLTYLKINYPLEIFIKEQLAIFPEFFRYGMLTIFKYINHQKQRGLCNGVYVYTNNTCIPITWTNYIMRFVENEIKQPEFFNHIIRAFKIDGEVVECSRTTMDKTYSDLTQCVDLPEGALVCFVDDLQYVEMMHRHVLYIQPYSYSHHLTQTEIIDRFVANYPNAEPSLKSSIKSWYCNNNNEYKLGNHMKTPNELAIDIEVTKKMFHYIKKFIRIVKKRILTRSNRITSLCKTRKNRTDE